VADTAVALLSAVRHVCDSGSSKHMLGVVVQSITMDVPASSAAEPRPAGAAPSATGGSAAYAISV
jgi:hypothetical protein